jgi:hypothetical protein
MVRRIFSKYMRICDPFYLIIVTVLWWDNGLVGWISILKLGW